MALLKVGSKGEEVRALQRALSGALKIKLADDGDFGGETKKAVMNYQKKVGLFIDGKAGDKTLAKLGLINVAARPETLKSLSEQDVKDAAALLGVPLAAVKAVTEVEALGHGFLSNGRCKILFERHKFKEQLLKVLPRAKVAALEKEKPNLINSKRGGYSGNAAEWVRFDLAAAIHRDCAIQATSFGMFQIMGFNFALAGHKNPEEFYVAMQQSEAAHLQAFCHFVISQKTMHEALKKQNWPVFARLYNGAAYKENLYDVKLERAFNRYKKEG